MSRLRKQAAVFALLATLFVSTSALAAPRGDDGGFASRLKTFIVRIFEDIRASFPPG
jgi:hypothetical protein